MTHCFVLFSVLNIEVSCKVSFGAKKGIPQQKHLTWLDSACKFCLPHSGQQLKPQVSSFSLHLVPMHALFMSQPKV